MNHLSKRDIVILVGLLVIYWLVLFLASLVISIYNLYFGLGLMLFILAYLILFSFRQTEQNNQKSFYQNYRQIEELKSLHSLIKVSAPLPSMRGWAISPDFANIIFSLIKETKPAVVVDLGSGVSTLISGYALRQMAVKGKILALDHNEKYVQISQTQVEQHGLSDLAEVVLAPLEEIKINDQPFLWYKFDWSKVNEIDLLIVDGPPQKIKNSRYPALPVLYKYLSSRAVILVDDYCVADTKAMINLWLKEFGDLKLEIINTEKGAAILRKN